MAINLISDAHAGGTLHVFEAAGLGKAPFRFVRFEVKKYQACPEAPVQPGASCDYCGTGIMNVYWLRGVDGREFKVGCDCVARTGDAGLRRVISQHESKIRREKADALRLRTAASLKSILEDEAVRSALSGQPHPNAYYASNGRSLLDWAEFVRDRAGTSAQRVAVKAINRVLETK